MYFSFHLLNRLHLSFGSFFHFFQHCAMCAMNAMKLLMKSMFYAWKLDVKNLTNEHRMNGEKTYGIR
jgi:uncharacterized membrane protein